METNHTLDNKDSADAATWEKESLLNRTDKTAQDAEWADETDASHFREGIAAHCFDQEANDKVDYQNKTVASVFILVVIVIWLLELEVTRNLFEDSGKVNSYFLIWMARNLYIAFGFGTARLLCAFSDDDQIFSFFVWQPTRKNLVPSF